MKRSQEAIGRELLKCKKSLHPGVSMWTFVQIGDPARVASEGDGCGAAIRAAPVGVIYPSSSLEDRTRGAYECAAPTHGGQMAICGAAAVAGAVSAALEGRPSVEVLSVALKAAKKAEAFRPSEEVLTVMRSIETIYSNLMKNCAARGRPSQLDPGTLVSISRMCSGRNPSATL